MKTRQIARKPGAKLPPPPAQRKDLVKGIGWSWGPAIRRTRKKADAELAPVLLSDGERAGLPSEPAEPLPLPEPPPQQPDIDKRGG
jgi:hypothetical protein